MAHSVSPVLIVYGFPVSGDDPAAGAEGVGDAGVVLRVKYGELNSFLRRTSVYNHKLTQKRIRPVFGGRTGLTLSRATKLFKALHADKHACNNHTGLRVGIYILHNIVVNDSCLSHALVWVTLVRKRTWCVPCALTHDQPVPGQNPVRVRDIVP